MWLRRRGRDEGRISRGEREIGRERIWYSVSHQ